MDPITVNSSSPLQEVAWQSQFGQDKWLMENVFSGKRNGFFIDCGCNNPVKGSNTYAMEQFFDWTGIGIDVHIQTGFPPQRPGTIPFQACLSSSSGLVVDIVHGGGTTGIHDDSSNDHIRTNILQNKSYKTITTTLTHVLDVCGAPEKIDLFSLDTEGHEISILEGLDRDKYTIEYICVETPYTKIGSDNQPIFVGRGREKFEGFMAYIGYKLVESSLSSDTIWRYCG
jgi:hypothetical protein